MAEHNEIGKDGEAVARAFLMKQGFKIIETNYRTKFGEIDIIALKDKKINFVEVKSVKVRGFDNLEKLKVRPEDNLTSSKLSKILKSVDIYLSHKSISHETKYEIDLACVYLNSETREGRVKIMENIQIG